MSINKTRVEWTFFCLEMSITSDGYAKTVTETVKPTRPSALLRLRLRLPGKSAISALHIDG